MSQVDLSGRAAKAPAVLAQPTTETFQTKAADGSRELNPRVATTWATCTDFRSASQAAICGAIAVFTSLARSSMFIHPFESHFHVISLQLVRPASLAHGPAPAS